MMNTAETTSGVCYNNTVVLHTYNSVRHDPHQDKPGYDEQLGCSEI